MCICHNVDYAMHTRIHQRYQWLSATHALTQSASVDVDTACSVSIARAAAPSWPPGAGSGVVGPIPVQHPRILFLGMLGKFRNVGRGINCQMVLGVHTLKRKLSSWVDVMLLHRESSELGLLGGMLAVDGGICVRNVLPKRYNVTFGFAQLNAAAPASESKEVARG
jgi:hypothetical protein